MTGHTMIRGVRSGCGGCFWTLLVLFLLFAPAVWVSSGSLPVGVAVLMYAALAVVVLAKLAQAKRRQPPPA